MVRYESKNFDFYVPPDQTFLVNYALPALEKTVQHYEKVFGRASGKIRVEIYPTKESFSAASTLSMEILKRSGAIGICKFHRLMILSPRALPLGYRWMDALSHEYTHLLVNELSWSKAELWLHEGTARYFDTTFRTDPPVYLSPHQKTKLLEAMEDGTLVTFKRMSPSLVYLKNQDEVSLAFSQVSYAVGQIIQRKGPKKFKNFLKSLRKKPFSVAFKNLMKMNKLEFQENLKNWMAEENWEKTKGTMSDDVRFEQLDEDEVIGASVKGRIRLGDRMRKKRLFDAALIEYKKALQEEPENAIILLKTARTHLALNQTQKAIENLQHAVQNNPNYGTPHLVLATLVSPREARSLLETANDINPFDPTIHKLLAEVYEKLGEKDKAKMERDVYKKFTIP